MSFRIFFMYKKLEGMFKSLENLEIINLRVVKNENMKRIIANEATELRSEIDSAAEL